jgi:hypothetical protein
MEFSIKYHLAAMALAFLAKITKAPAELDIKCKPSLEA